MLRNVLLTSLLLACTACASTDTHSDKADRSDGVDPAALDAAIAGDWRDPKNSARDRYRHPKDTLGFFGVSPGDTVVEITPGAAGWYTEILAPYLRERGRYVAAMVDPATTSSERSRGSQQRALDALKARLSAHPDRLDRAQFHLFDAKVPSFGAPGSVDRVLTFRNVHNWVAAGTAPQWFKAFHDVLEPGGTLGVVDHRAKPGTDLETMKKSGYLTEELVISLATEAGFRLEARSEVNANPKDTTDHPDGVWTLPPTNSHDPEEAQKYLAIGESDRMTLRFVKPAAK